MHNTLPNPAHAENPEYFYAELALGLATLRFATNELARWSREEPSTLPATAQHGPSVCRVRLDRSDDLAAVTAFLN